MSGSDEVSRLPDEYLDMLAEATGFYLQPGDRETALKIRRRRVRAALREIAKEDAARERGLDPKTAKTR